jgi:hypothetical protein
MKKSLLFLSVLLVTGCPGQPTSLQPGGTPTPVATASIKPTTLPSPLVTPSTVPSAAPVSPVPTATVQATVTPSPTPVPSPTSSPKESKFIIGMGNPFFRVTENLTNDAQNETLDIIDELENINTSYVIVDLKQKLIDSDLDALKIQWSVYDNILDGLRNKGIHAILRVYHDRILYPSNISADNTPAKNYISFIEETEKRYKEYDISWMFGDKVNDENSIPGSQQEYVDFLGRSSDAIKKISAARPVYMGSFVQSEIFGQKIYYTAENLLSYLNLGADKYVNGFIFEIYSLAFNDNKDFNSESHFNGTSYKIEKPYYDSFTEILKQKKVENKKIFMVTSTYDSTTVNELTLTEEQQANDLARRLIYGIVSGFDSIYLPDFIDKKYGETNDFFQRRGLIQKDDNSDPYRKLSFWTLKFIDDLLKDATYKGVFENLPANDEGYIFENGNKKYYVIWNNDENFKDNLTLKIKAKTVKLYTAPTLLSNFGININLTPDDSGQYIISFNSYPQNIRILEATE